MREGYLKKKSKQDRQNVWLRDSILIVALTALAAGTTARRFLFTDPDIPIILVKTSFGVGHRTRINCLEAIVHVRHLTEKEKVNFQTSGPLPRHYRGIQAPGDGRGQLVGAQFSGPPKWFNLTPQYVRVNRNLGYQAITKAWFKAERAVREFLEGGW